MLWGLLSETGALLLKSGMTTGQKLILILGVTVAGVAGMWLRFYHHGKNPGGGKGAAEKGVHGNPPREKRGKKRNEK